MPIDLEIASYGVGKNIYPVFNDGPIPRKRKTFNASLFKPENKTELHKRVQRLRHSTWRRQEAHNRQLQVFLNRQRFQENQSMHAEYDRLISQSVPVELQPFVHDRLAQLKQVML